MNTADWHRRFSQQAQWTSDTRGYLFNLAGVPGAENVLDVGCGTGALTSQLVQMNVSHAVGIDINREFIAAAAAQKLPAEYIQGDAYALPFRKSTFDCSFCHYVLMWLADPQAVLLEMKRVTKPGACVLALAEPDYGGRIDHPVDLEQLNRWQAAALQTQGADPYFGRKLKGLFHKSGFTAIQVGVIGSQWKKAPSQDELESEWSIIQHDLTWLADEPSEVSKTLQNLRQLELNAWSSGERVLYVPTFYALGRVPAD